MLSTLFLGSGRLLIACAEHWLSQGRQIGAVVSDCSDISAWAKTNGIRRISPSELEALQLKPASFDYLFSIVNHAITPAPVLALAKRAAINFHDAPLPRFSGFNATSWAIMDGQSRHAVTWHLMSAEVDSGDILLQQSVEIQPDDTAFSLGAICIEAGLVSFRQLASLLIDAETAGTPLKTAPQEPRQDFHLRSDRPGPGLIDFDQPAAKVSAFVRALDLGTDDNWMCRPKLMLASGVYIVGEIAAEAQRGQSAGEILAVEHGSLIVATADASVRCAQLTTLEGAPVDCSTLGLAPGLVLPRLSEASGRWLAELDARLTKQERFWVGRLSAQRSPALPTLRTHAGPSEAALLLRTLSGPQQSGAIVAALAAYLARVCDDTVFDLALAKQTDQETGQFYASAVPMRWEIDLAAGFSRLAEAAQKEMGVQETRGTFARDAFTRYGALRSRAETRQPLTVGVRFQSLDDLEPLNALVPDTVLTLIVPPQGLQVGWAYDRAVLSEAELKRLVERVETLLASALLDPSRPVGELDLLPPAERELLLTTWQDTAAPFADKMCVHELFEAQVDRTPDAVAVTWENTSLTYRELDQRANAVAHALKGRGVGPDVLVGVCIERSLDLVIGLMGVLKAGGAYVPMDAAYPRGRLGMMIEDSKSPIILTQQHLLERLPPHGAEVLCIETLHPFAPCAKVVSASKPENLAYVIFTSGSTGRPKGVMVEHRNVANFFTGMDERIGTKPGVWLAVTSISFDISVLELFWTLARGFEVVIQGESDRASLERKAKVQVSKEPMAFGLFYFAADQGGAEAGATYRLLLEGARFADTHDFSAVWTPERHFHAFGGLYPNPAVTTAALSTITSRIALRAGSIVLPLHNPLRVAEDWSVIDQLSGGRVGLSFASGWHADDFAFMPENYERRREIMLESIEKVLKLWRGEKVNVINGQGKDIAVSVLPRPVQAAPPIWIASAGSVDTFKLAGRLGANVLTNMLGQDIDDLRNKFAAYRAARREAGHEGPGNISVMLHTFVCADTDQARELARKPFCEYLKSSYDLIKVAPTMFPAFRQPSTQAGQQAGFDATAFTDEDMDALLDHAFDRYFQTAGLFGSPENAIVMVERLKSIGANEVACLVDFGIAPEIVLENLPHLDRLRRMANAATSESAEVADYGIAHQIRARGVTHLQCTPSMARMLAGDEDSLAALSSLERLMLGGEALPTDLAETLLPAIRGEVLNMYGPTETTIWSTTSKVSHGEPITIGRPIANTVIRILDTRGQLAPVGVAGELCIGGAGVVRGYLGRPDLTAERFVTDPCSHEGRLYRTGDLCRYRETGDIEFIGRLDHQVKVNGYRIELGEIETVLGRHPGVHQSVVVARSDDNGPQLVGYVIPSAKSASGELSARVSQWEALWDEAYQHTEDVSDPRFNIAGWSSSFSGEMIPADAMREWLDLTARSILALKPENVLEIGCGTGMVLYQVLPHVAHYTAVDLSARALDLIHEELTPAERLKVTLLKQPAETLEGAADGTFDTVIINSVCQYFPSGDYFVRVLKRASRLLKAGGRIFIGDVRSLEHQAAFHALAAVQQAPAHLTGKDLAQRISKRVAQESELVISSEFFNALRSQMPGISGVDVRLKSGRASTEMNAFRYDVTLHFGDSIPEAVLPEASNITSLDGMRDALSASPPAIVVENLANARLSSAYGMLRHLSDRDTVTAAELRSGWTAESDSVDPGDLVQLDSNYDVALLPASSGDPARFDAVFRHKVTGPKGALRQTSLQHNPAREWFNQPAIGQASPSDLFDELRAHVREFLPEYMIPSAFVAMDAFPLTPNGKIDRKSLPPPTREAPRAQESSAAPRSVLEQTIADVWKGLLGIEHVGLRDNIFDLGANSLLTAQANQRLSQILGRKISLVTMFRCPTVELLAKHLGGDASGPEAETAQTDKQADRKKTAAARRRELRGEVTGA